MATADELVAKYRPGGNDGLGAVTADDLVAKYRPIQAAPQQRQVSPQQRQAAPSAEDKALAFARRTTQQNVRPGLGEAGYQLARQATGGGVIPAIEAGAGAIGSQAGRLFGQDPGFGLGQEYNAQRQAIAERTRQRENPLNTAAGVAGGVGGLALGGGEALNALRGAKALPAVAGAAGRGVAYGLAGGATGAKRYQDIPRESAIGGSIGAPLGVAGERLAPIAERLVGRAADKLIGSKLLNPLAEAERILSDKLKKEGVNLELELKKAGATGVDLSFLDVAGGRLRQLVRQSGGDTSRAAKVLDAYRDKLLANTAADAVKQTKKLVGEQRPAEEVKQALIQQRKETARVTYAKDYKTPVDVKPFLPALADPETDRVIRDARRTAVLRRDYDTAKDIDALLSLKKEAANRTPKELDRYLAENPQLAAAGAFDTLQTSFQQASKNLLEKDRSGASGLLDRAKEIGSHLDQVPSLKSARETYRVQSEAIDGFERGADFLKEGEAGGFINAQAFNKLSKAAQQTTRIGVGQSVNNALNANAPAALRKIALDKNVAETLHLVLGRDEAERYIRAAQYRLERVKNANYVTGGQPSTEGFGLGLAHTPAGIAKHSIFETAKKAVGSLSAREAEALARLATSRARVLPSRKARRTLINTGQAIGLGASTTAGYDR